MSALKVLAVAFAATGFTAVQAQAMSITNRDANNRMVYIEKSSVPADVEAQSYTEEVLVKGRKTVNNTCQQGCSVRLAGSGDVVTLNGKPRIEIRHGKLHVLQK